MQHPCAFRPEEHAVFDAKKMGKATLFESPRLMLGLNCFEPGQEHKLHAHPGLDKIYQVLSGEGVFVLADRELPMRAGDMLVAPGRRAARHPQHRAGAAGGARDPGAGAVTPCAGAGFARDLAQPTRPRHRPARQES